MKPPFVFWLSSALILAGLAPSWSETAPSPQVSPNNPTLARLALIASGGEAPPPAPQESAAGSRDHSA